MLAFIHIPKAAGTTLATILRRNLGWRHFDTRFFSNRPVFTAEDFRRICWLYPNLCSIAGHGITGTSDLPSVIPDVRYYSIFREPVSRVVSQFQFNWNCLSNAEKSVWHPRDYFHKVILKEFANVQTRMLVGDGDASQAIQFIRDHRVFVGLTERFDESLVMFRRWSRLPNLDIRYRSVNRTSSINDQLVIELKREIKTDRALTEWIRSANRHDVDLYEYVVERFESQILEYGPDLSCDLQVFREQQAVCGAISTDRLLAKLYRNLVYKPLRPVIFRSAA